MKDTPEQIKKQEEYAQRLFNRATNFVSKNSIGENGKSNNRFLLFQTYLATEIVTGVCEEIPVMEELAHEIVRRVERG